MKKFELSVKTGRGYLLELWPRERRSDRSPELRGALVLPRDYKKGHKLRITAWKHSFKNGKTLISISVVTQEVIRKYITTIIQTEKRDRESIRQMILDKAEHEAGEWPRKKVNKPRPPMQPKELKRKDVL